MKRIQDWESLVLTGEEWNRLRYHDVQPGSLTVFTVALDGTGYREFTEGADYAVDWAGGRLRRLPDSSIGDYANSPFYGKAIFNHEDYNGQWGSYPFMIYVSYTYEADGNILTEDEARRITLSAGLPDLRGSSTLRRLLAGESLTYMVYGDSISTGAEAIRLEHAYFTLFANRLMRCTGGRVTVVNKAVGGTNSDGGRANFAAALEEVKPDLVSIAYGVNDMCVHGEDQSGPSEVTPERFEENITAMVEAARAAGAEVVLITNLIPNPGWKFTCVHADAFPERMRCVARRLGVPLADTWRLWENENTHGKRGHDILLNDVNHPTTYGHGLYAQMLYTLI